MASPWERHARCMAVATAIALPWHDKFTAPAEQYHGNGMASLFDVPGKLPVGKLKRHDTVECFRHTRDRQADRVDRVPDTKEGNVRLARKSSVALMAWGLGS